MVERIGTIHNPIRIAKFDGQDVDWYDFDRQWDVIPYGVKLTFNKAGDVIKCEVLEGL